MRMHPSLLPAEKNMLVIDVYKDQVKEKKSTHESSVDHMTLTHFQNKQLDLPSWSIYQASSLL